MEAGAFQERREAIGYGGIIIGKEEGGSVGWHCQNCTQIVLREKGSGQAKVWPQRIGP